MPPDTRSFPAALVVLADVTFDPPDVDYQTLKGFVPAAEMTEWLQLWTGNPTVEGDAFRVFGQDISGGYVTLWLARDSLCR